MKAYNFCFFLFLEIGHVTNLPTTMAWTLTHRIIMILYFLTLTFLSDFLATMSYLPYLEMCTDHVDTTSSLSTTVSIMSILFSPIFWLYLHQLPYWEMCTDHVSNASTLSQRVYIRSIFFSSFFLIFLLYLHELPY